MLEKRPERVLVAAFPNWSLAIALLASLAAFTVVLSGQGHWLLQRAEQVYADIRTSLLSDRTSTEHPDIVLISVGSNVSATRSTFGQSVEIDRGDLARLIDAIDDAAPRAIGLDVALLAPTETAKDQSLQRALREAKTRVVHAVRDDYPDLTPERRNWRDRFIAGTGRAKGHVSQIYEGDRVVRFDSGTHAISGTPESFAVLMARALRPEVRRDFGRIAWLQKVNDGGVFSRFVNFGAQQPFRLIYADDMLDVAKTVPPRQLAGRLVLVTSGFAEIERHRTPLSLWSGDAVPPIQIQAQAIAQLLDGRGTAEPEPRVVRLALFAMALLGGVVGWYRRRNGLIVGGLLLTLVTLIVADALTFASMGLALPIVLMILTWFLGEAAGRGLRHVLDWEERHGQRWPLEEETDGPSRVTHV